MAELPTAGWTYDYVSIEGRRLGQLVFRPAVPVAIGTAGLAPELALVDSGSEHTLASRWIAELYVEAHIYVATLFQLNGAGHAMLPEQAGVVAAAIVEFLSHSPNLTGSL